MRQTFSVHFSVDEARHSEVKESFGFSLVNVSHWQKQRNKQTNKIQPLGKYRENQGLQSAVDAPSFISVLGDIQTFICLGPQSQDSSISPVTHTGTKGGESECFSG
jgi:hypothetical protein